MEQEDLAYAHTLGDHDELVELHLGFAKALAHRLRLRLPLCVDVEELESDAYLGLLKEARTFDPDRGVLFRTFVAPRIRDAILDVSLFHLKVQIRNELTPGKGEAVSLLNPAADTHGGYENLHARHLRL